MNTAELSLLRKYMKFVRDCEGTDFVEHIKDPWGCSEIQFSPEELSTLESLSEANRK